MRAAAALALALAAATSAATVSAQPAGPGPGGPGGAGSSGGRPPRQSYADPSAIIAADLALSHAARDKGQWQALRKAAAPGAVTFAPRAVDAAAWLKSRRELGRPERWSPRTVWMSCDGNYAVSRGVWTRGAEAGDYVTIWERQEKGDWKWLVRDEDGGENSGAEPEMIAGNVAECHGLIRRGRPPRDMPPMVPADAVSYDRSLRWSIQVAADCSRAVTVEAWDGKALVPVITARRGPPATGCN